MKESCLISVGLDIGTCTTKLVLSRITIAKSDASLTISPYEIKARKLLYQSPIYPTPLIDSSTIDATRLASILKAELHCAGVALADISSGAVIMTGETATKINAKSIVHQLAKQAGNFVVATAGSDLEAIMAGKGSGAALQSMNNKIVANMDIGGGTANVAWFKNGMPIATKTFHMGGSLIRLQADGRLTYISSAIKSWLANQGLTIMLGSFITKSELEDLAMKMAKTVVTYLVGADPKGPRSAELLACDGQLFSLPRADEWILSGGVAALLPAPVLEMDEITRYGDIGPILAKAVGHIYAKLGIKLIRAKDAQRATVIGAGIESLVLSGSTIHVDDRALPVRNVPIIKFELPKDAFAISEQLLKLFISAIKIFGTSADAPFGIALIARHSCTYQQLQELTNTLAPLLNSHFAKEQTAVILCDRDMAKALGQLLSLKCQGKPKIVCVDGVSLDFGDYVDLGEMIGNRTIPVMVKTLIFKN